MRRSAPRSTCSHTSVTARILGVAAYIAAGICNQSSTAIFGQLLSEHNVEGPSTKKARYVSSTWERFVSSGDVGDAPRAGRPADIEASLVEEAADILEKGYKSNGRQC